MVQASLPPLLTIPEERKQEELRNAQAREASERQAARPALFIFVICVAWQFIGAAFMLASAHSQDSDIANALFAASFVVGYGGAFFSLVVFYVQGQDRGDW